MHGWGVVDLRVNLAKKNHGYSIPARSYDFCPHLTQLDILDFTLSHIQSTPVEWAVRKGGGLNCHARLNRSPSGAPHQSFSMSLLSNQWVHFCLAYIFTLKFCLQVGNEFWEIFPSNIHQFLSLQPCMQSMSPVQLSCLYWVAAETVVDGRSASTPRF